MMVPILVIHAIICALLIIIILIQRGRGGGLLETFSGVESLFGTKTNAFLSRTTSVLAVIFFVTCLTLAIMAAAQSKSLLRSVPRGQLPQQQQESIVVTQPQAEQELPPDVKIQEEQIVEQSQPKTEQPEIPQLPKTE